MKLKVGAGAHLKSHNLSGMGLTVDAGLIKSLYNYSKESEDLLCATVWMSVSLQRDRTLSKMVEAICCEMDLWLIALENYLAKLGGLDAMPTLVGVEKSKGKDDLSSVEISTFIDGHERLAGLSLRLADLAYNQGNLRIWEMMNGRSLFHDRAADLLRDLLMNEVRTIPEEQQPKTKPIRKIYE